MDDSPSSAAPEAAMSSDPNAEIKRLREALRAKDARIAELERLQVSHANAQLLGKMGSWEIDARADELIISPELRQLFNMEEEPKITLHEIFSIIAPEHINAAKSIFYDPLAEGETRTVRIRINPIDDEPHELRLTATMGRPDGGELRRYGITQDIKELVAAERVIEDKEERWQLAIEGSDDGVWDWDLATDVIHFSDRWKSMLGYKPDEVVNHFDSWKRLVHPDDKPGSMELIEEYMRGETKQLELEFRLKAKNGDWVWILSRGKAVFDADGKPVRMLGTHTDITERKKQEEAFKRLSLVASKTTTGVVITDAQGQLSWVNKAFEKVTGYHMHEVTGKSPGSILQGPATDKAIVDHMRKCVRNGKGFHVEILNYRKSGVPFWAEVEATPIHDIKGNLVNFIAITNDITTRRLDRERIEESERRFRDISNAANEFIWEHDIDGVFTYATDRVQDILGYTAGEFVGLHPMDIIQPGYEKVLEDEMLLHIQNTEIFSNFELPNVCKDGSIVWLTISGVPMFDNSGQLIGYRGAAMDITSRKKAEKELSHLYQRFQLATSSARIGIWEYDFELQSLVWDSIMHEIYRLPPKRLSHSLSCWSRVIIPEDYPMFKSTLETAMERGGNYRLNYRIAWPGGDIRYITGNALVQLNDNGQPARIIGSSWDVTEQKRAEQDAIAAKNTAEDANRAKSAFLAMMSHEIRTPMNGVLGMIQALKESTLNTEQQDFVDTIETSSGSLMTIIDDILDYSKVEAGRLALDPRPLNVASIIKGALTLYSTHADEKKLELIHRIEDDVPPAVLGDEMRIRQVLVNLISNAIKFTDRGRVTVKLSAKRLADDSVELHFSVSDTGIGFSKEQANTIFEPFVQADASITRRHGGTGLGLAISRRLVELMGGKIWCESSRLLGTIFHFTIASRIIDPNSLKVKNDAELDELDYQGRILLAEDNPVNRKVVQFILTRLGCTADSATDGKEALDLHRKQPYDLVLMDVQMPNVDGLAATREMRRMSGEGERPWIIGLSAAAMKEDKDAAIEAGMNDFLHKPLKPQELEAALRHAPTLK
ncbi:PAS domain-containing hybrid sensor histidine kinase/response regulator [Cerasicoccus maritimus]|uniref:PAS domain-containing hybrid sensor histidine kinase/response regulator n=1 Tax=Cerasicoccus maritimus TaxID=490089 RepID=UPI002852D37E|nr:PAS domain S-box protein [Cerasicoccus maritimus]